MIFSLLLLNKLLKNRIDTVLSRRDPHVTSQQCNADVNCGLSVVHYHNEASGINMALCSKVCTECIIP